MDESFRPQETPMTKTASLVAIASLAFAGSALACDDSKMSDIAKQASVAPKEATVAVAPEAAKPVVAKTAKPATAPTAPKPDTVAAAPAPTTTR